MPGISKRIKPGFAAAQAMVRAVDFQKRRGAWALIAVYWEAMVVYAGRAGGIDWGRWRAARF